MQRHEFIQALLTVTQTGQAVIARHDGRHYKLARRPTGILIATWGARLGPRTLEEIGEDAGMIEPRVRAPVPIAEHPRATLISEGYAGALCTHTWAPLTHVKGRPSGYITRCLICGVRISRATTGQAAYEYDNWHLRAHVFHAWTITGPPPGALRVQDHH